MRNLIIVALITAASSALASPPLPAPDNGTSVLLLGGAVAGLVFAKKWFTKR